MSAPFSPSFATPPLENTTSPECHQPSRRQYHHFNDPTPNNGVSQLSFLREGEPKFRSLGGHSRFYSGDERNSIVDRSVGPSPGKMSRSLANWNSLDVSSNRNSFARDSWNPLKDSHSSFDSLGDSSFMKGGISLKSETPHLNPIEKSSSGFWGQAASPVLSDTLQQVEQSWSRPSESSEFVDPYYSFVTRKSPQTILQSLAHFFSTYTGLELLKTRESHCLKGVILCNHSCLKFLVTVSAEVGADTSETPSLVVEFQRREGDVHEFNQFFHDTVTAATVAPLLAFRRPSWDQQPAMDWSELDCSTESLVSQDEDFARASSLSLLSLTSSNSDLDWAELDSTAASEDCDSELAAEFAQLGAMDSVPEAKSADLDTKCRDQLFEMALSECLDVQREAMRTLLRLADASELNMALIAAGCAERSGRSDSGTNKLLGVLTCALSCRCPEIQRCGATLLAIMSTVMSCREPLASCPELVDIVRDRLNMQPTVISVTQSAPLPSGGRRTRRAFHNHEFLDDSDSDSDSSDDDDEEEEEDQEEQLHRVQDEFFRETRHIDYGTPAKRDARRQLALALCQITQTVVEPLNSLHPALLLHRDTTDQVLKGYVSTLLSRLEPPNRRR